MKLKLTAMTPDGTLINISVTSVQFEHYYEIPKAIIKCCDGTELDCPASWIIAIRMVEE